MWKLWPSHDAITYSSISAKPMRAEPKHEPWRKLYPCFEKPGCATLTGSQSTALFWGIIVYFNIQLVNKVSKRWITLLFCSQSAYRLSFCSVYIWFFHSMSLAHSSHTLTFPKCHVKRGSIFHHHHHQFLWCIIINAVYMVLMQFFLSLVPSPLCC